MKRIKTILTLHAEYPYTGGCGHAYDCENWITGCGHCPILREGTQSIIFDGTHHTWLCQQRCYDRFDPKDLIITCVSPWLKSRADKSPMLSRFDKRVVLNGCDTRVFYPRQSNYWHEKLNLTPEQKIIAHVAAFFSPERDDLKGGRYVYQLAERFKDSSYVFVVAANFGNAPNAPDNLYFVGRTETQDRLAELYSEAVCTVLTSKRETFSMVLAESLCCGTPVVGFLCGGAESISINDYSTFSRYGDIDELTKIIEECISRKLDKDGISHMAKSKYGKNVMIDGYTRVYKSICKGES